MYKVSAKASGNAEMVLRVQLPFWLQRLSRLTGNVVTRSTKAAVMAAFFILKKYVCLHYKNKHYGRGTN